MSTRKMTTYVLVHGSWHGGWCWQKLLPFLRQDNLTLYTPTLTGLGERSHVATPITGLSVHIQDIVNLLEFEDLNEVILVGHSYGGMVITGVAEYSERVGKLVYLNASRQDLRENDTMGESMWKSEEKEEMCDSPNYLTPIRYSDPCRVAPTV